MSSQSWYTEKRENQASKCLTLLQSSIMSGSVRNACSRRLHLLEMIRRTSGWSRMSWAWQEQHPTLSCHAGNVWARRVTWQPEESNSILIDHPQLHIFLTSPCHRDRSCLECRECLIYLMYPMLYEFQNSWISRTSQPIRIDRWLSPSSPHRPNQGELINSCTVISCSHRLPIWLNISHHITAFMADTDPYAAYPAPSHTSPKTIDKEALFKLIHQKQPGKDFLLIDVRRNDHEVLLTCLSDWPNVRRRWSSNLQSITALMFSFRAERSKVQWIFQLRVFTQVSRLW